MRWQLHSERILVDEISRHGGLLPMEDAGPALCRQLGVSSEFASSLVRRLVQARRLAVHARFLSLGAHVECTCGARMFPAALARTGGVCPRCRRMLTT
jgi:hypothetical protein